MDKRRINNEVFQDVYGGLVEEQRNHLERYKQGTPRYQAHLSVYRLLAAQMARLGLELEPVPGMAE